MVWSQSADLPALEDTVSDSLNLISPGSKQAIRSLASELAAEKQINLKIALVVSTDQADSGNFGKALYNCWKMGSANPAFDRGLLVLVSISDRKVNILAGEGLKSVMTNDTIDKMEWNIISAISSGDFSRGILMGTIALTDLMMKENPKPTGKVPKLSWGALIVVGLPLIIISLILAIVVGGGFGTGFATFVGGIFGFLTLGVYGMILGGALGFFLSLGKDHK